MNVLGSQGIYDYMRKYGIAPEDLPREAGHVLEDVKEYVFPCFSLTTNNTFPRAN